MTNLSGANLNNGAAVGPQGEGMDSPSNFPKYPEYKDSGAEWLGEIPGHWAVFIAKRMFGNVRESASADAEQLAATQAYGVIPQKDFMERNDTKVVLALSGTENFRAVKANDFVISLRSFQGGIEHSAYDGCVSPAYTVLRRKDERNLNPGYLRYLLKDASYISALQSVTTGIREGRTITYEQFGSLSMPVAPVAEQTQIARFLDHETARIDALIEEQQRLIELLKEKRQAVISQAVTKGLDPTVPMKDSGVEWLGEVPAHWIVAGLKWFWSVTDCKHITAEFVDDGVPLASIREVQCRYVTLENAKQTTDVFYRQLIEAGRKPVAGDLIFSRNATVGEVAQVADWHPPFAMGQDVCLLKKQFEWLSSDYLQAVLRSPVVTVQLDNLMIGSTFKRVNVEDIRGLVVPMPPEKEQQLIADYLNSETGQFDSLLAECQGTIGLLQERRSALISAAVTGKIDVRGWQPPAHTQAPESAVAEAN
ncbi:restriction endonuclease subunit S [Pseudomonas mendocina]|uniref:restriction endonuclease subunit S n=1 Tax=unclassified Pseudomonas TaxID=196821 RepID=UPI0020212A6F|nr:MULTISPECIES: restriction endonuclease subunit S [Pseudomonas]MDV5860603.1 restriction endonuclease subunit S [Pseudomonas mendocina]URD41590.1 restriction endonuclease subunit S [Pseudomonas sp. BYT-5]